MTKCIATVLYAEKLKLCSATYLKALSTASSNSSSEANILEAETYSKISSTKRVKMISAGTNEDISFISFASRSNKLTLKTMPSATPSSCIFELDSVTKSNPKMTSFLKCLDKKG